MPSAETALTGKIPTQILRNSLPGVIAMLASAAPVLLDALLLSRSGSDHAAAAAAGYPVLLLMQTIGFTLGTGAGSHVSRCLGQGDRENALRAASTAFFLSLLLSGALCMVGFMLVLPLSRLLGTDAASMHAACGYIRYVLLCGPLLCMNLVLGSLLRAQAQAVANMIAYVSGGCIGCALEFLLISVCRFGIRGSGIAMLARETAVFFVLAISVFQRKMRLRPRIGLFSPSRAVLAAIMRSGTPTLLRQGMTSLSSALLSRSAAAFGSAAFAGLGLSMRASAFISSAIIGFGQGFQPVCGMAFGAGNTKRVLDAYHLCQRILLIALPLLGAAVYVCAAPIMSFFSASSESAAAAAFCLKAQSVTFFAQGAVIMMNMLTQSVGLSVHASFIAASRQGYVLIPLILIMPRLFGLTGLLLCQSISDMLSLLLCLLITRSVTRSWCAPCEYSHAQKASQ